MNSQINQTPFWQNNRNCGHVLAASSSINWSIKTKKREPETGSGCHRKRAGRWYRRRSWQVLLHRTRRSGGGCCDGVTATAQQPNRTYWLHHREKKNTELCWYNYAQFLQTKNEIFIDEIYLLSRLIIIIMTKNLYWTDVIKRILQTVQVT